MHKPRRILRIAKWCCAIVSLFFASSWALSTCVAFQYVTMPPRWQVYVDSGSFCVCYQWVFYVSEMFGGDGFWAHPFNLSILRFEIYPNDDNIVVVIPHWILLTISVPATIMLWRRDRRTHPPGHCRRCGYSLTGNTSGKCPECGETVALARTE